MVQREVPPYAGVYINGQIQGVDVTFTVDTGATSTILASRVYGRILPRKRPSLQVPSPSADLVGADGGKLTCKGRAVFDIRLGPLQLGKEISVADIADEDLLGANILQGSKLGPMDLLLSENRMVFGNTSIPVQQFGLPKKDIYARVADHYIIPGMSQMVIEVFVDWADRPQSSVDQVLVETKPSLIDRHSVLLAPTVLNVGDRVTGSIIVLNPFTQQVSLKQDEVIACVEQIVGVNTVLLHQESLDSESLSERELAGTETEAGAVKNGCQQKAPCPANEFKSPSLDTNEHIYLQSNPLEGIKSYQSGVSPTGVRTLADETDVSPSVNSRERERIAVVQSLGVEPATETQTDAGQVTPPMEKETENSSDMEQSHQAVTSSSTLDVDSNDSQTVPEYLRDLYKRSILNKTEREEGYR